jgi:hypothetical protein
MYKNTFVLSQKVQFQTERLLKESDARANLVADLTITTGALAHKTFNVKSEEFKMPEKVCFTGNITSKYG